MKQKIKPTKLEKKLNISLIFFGRIFVKRFTSKCLFILKTQAEPKKATQDIMQVTISSDQIVGLLIIDLATTSYITENVKIIKAK